MNEEVISSVVEIALSSFNDTQLSPENKPKLAFQIREYILRKIPFSTLQKYAEQLTKTSQPLEQLREIMEISPEPIPECKEILYENATESKREKSRPWSQYEDQRLVAGIMRYGLENWTSISRFVGNSRTRAQCSQRWARGLDPKISKAQWTQQEENALIQLIQIHGNKAWTIISVHMRNRSDVQCRYKYKQLLKEKRIKLNDPHLMEVPGPQPGKPVYFPAQYPVQPSMMPYPISQPSQQQQYMVGYIPQQAFPQQPQIVQQNTVKPPPQQPQQPAVVSEPKPVPQAEHHKVTQHHTTTISTTVHTPNPPTKQAVSSPIQRVNIQPPPTVQQPPPQPKPQPAQHYIPVAQSPLYNIVPSLPPMEPNSKELPHVQNVFSYASPLIGSPMPRGDFEHKETGQQSEHVEVIRHEHSTAPPIATPSFNAKLYSVY